MKIPCTLWILFYYCSTLGYFMSYPPSSLPRMHESPLTVFVVSNFYHVNFLKIFLCLLLIVNISFWLLFYPITFARFVHFSSNPIFRAKHIRHNSVSLDPSFYLVYIILFVENIESLMLMLFIVRDIWPSFRCIRIPITRYPQFFLSISLLYHVVTYSTLNAPVLCIRIICYSYGLLGLVPPIWICFLKILLSNDIELNPGDFSDSFFSFCNWNINSLAKDDFKRIQLLEAHNSLYNYDLISLCEVGLNDSIEIPDPLLENYTFISKNKADNSRHGGVGLLYKNSLPLFVRRDLGFDEALVVELKFGRKKIFFTVLYRSPSYTNGSPEFETFLKNFECLFEKIKGENPFSMFFTGDFNGHSQLWWPGGNSTSEGTKIEELTNHLGLSQLISEPTNFEPNKNPSCIDLIFTDQPNLVIESGARSSLDPLCHHQITHCRFNYKIPPPPSFERKIWAMKEPMLISLEGVYRNFLGKIT